ncbi:hypothetical protein J437_LFUL011287 [Ladona fulva]|uniref:Uncharacterized protein n=1 Tax=Ladona fulva TaxID=123851 RepID=A0A8K0KLH4_LADFU|nr:hypothetical protein J437_LFUL011287 [Ladona fulva]
MDVVTSIINFIRVASLQHRFSKHCWKTPKIKQSISSCMQKSNGSAELPGANGELFCQPIHHEATDTTTAIARIIASEVENLELEITKHQAQLVGLSTGLKIPRGRGSRFVTLHTGSARGFVKGSKLVYLAKKRSGDYHDEMDSTRWFGASLEPKRHIASNNISFLTKEMSSLIDNAFTQISEENWASYERHTQKVEEEMWKDDELKMMWNHSLSG